MMRSRLVYVLVLFLLAAPLVGNAQVQGKFPPDSFINLKFFPKAIPQRELIGNMRNFTRALGVRCTFCHVGEESIPLGKYDFATDDKPTKRKAREMLKMVAAINEQHLAKLEKRVDPPLNVQCATCHRGVSQPRPLAEILLAAYQAAGIDSTLATYKALRGRYYGRASYDFGEATLADVADGATAASHPSDAVKLLELNAEFFPQSWSAYDRLAQGLAAAGDTARAIVNYQFAVALNPDDAPGKRRLDSLRASR